MKKELLLFNKIDDIDFNKMPFPKKWAENALFDKTDKVHGYLRVRAYDLSNKLIYDDGGDNQVMYWLKHSFSMLNAGVQYSTSGEHKGYEDNTGTEKTETNLPYGWHYLNVGGYVHSTHVWDNTTKTIAIENSIGNVNLFPFFPTKMRFGSGLPVGGVNEPINPDDIYLNDTNARGAGNVVGKLNFILISRSTHIAFSTTGFSTTVPSGYYSDYGGAFKNISIFQVTMPASVSGYCYDGKTLNEAGLFCDAALTDTASGGSYDQPNGMLLCKRYFNDIQKTNTISINFQWSIIC
jgi:hypothetical protein